MVLSVGLSRVDSIDLLPAASEWHISRVAVTIKLPRTRNHIIKVRVAINVTRNMIVVLNKFVQTDLVILLGISVRIVMLLEGFHKFNENFLFGTFALLHIWVLLSIVLFTKFFQTNFTILVDIESSESLLDKRLSEGVHFSNDYSKELTEVNLSTAIEVHGLEKVENVNLFNIYSEVFDGLNKFIFVKSARTIVVKDFELSGKTSNASSTASFKCLSESLHKDALELGHA